MARDLVAEARRQGVTESHYVRDVIARALGRADAREEMAELRDEVQDLRREVAGVHRDVRQLIQRFPRRGS